MDLQIIAIIAGSAGIWSVINTILNYFLEHKKRIDPSVIDVHSRALRGLLYGELEARCGAFLRKGEITPGELDDLRKYYYEPYKKLGGDGTIDALMSRVEGLPVL